MQVEVKEKNVYGVIRLYPANDIAELFTELLNKKTLEERDLLIIKKMGYSVNVIKLP